MTLSPKKKDGTMKVKIEIKSANPVPVTSLDPGTVFQYDGEEYGVRILDGWIVFDNRDGAVAYIDSEEKGSIFMTVVPLPGLTASLTIS